jgi:hypothetical protein
LTLILMVFQASELCIKYIYPLVVVVTL